MPFHETLNIPSSDRIIIIGDVHGCFDELQDLLVECDYNPNQDYLIFVGDLVNKGPKSIEVIRFIRATSKAKSVRGNHDDVALEAYHKYKKNWKKCPSKYAYTADFHEDDVRFLESLPFSLSLPNQNSIIVHAGLVPGVDISRQNLNDMYRMRLIQKDEGIGCSWKAIIKRSKDSSIEQFQWATVWAGPEHIYFGHDAKSNLQQEAFATGLDTGCVYGRKLTACILPAKKLVSVPARRVYEKPKSDD